MEIPISRKLVKVIGEGRIPKRDLARALAEYVAQCTSQVKGIDIDPNPADNGNIHTQVEWIDRFNQAKKPMITARDIYQAGQTGSDNLITSLRRDFDKSGLVVATRNTYGQNNLEGTITQNYGSTIVRSTRTKVLILVYPGTQLPNVLETSDGLAYFRAQVDTKDDPKKIAQTLERLSGKSPDSTYVYTPNQESRKERTERAVRFDYYFGRFRVDGSSWIGGDYGRSREGASLVKPAKQTHKKISVR